MKNDYDIVIIGSGISGLLCGDILSRLGYKVCILEKNKQIGGCLQTFVRNKVIFDSGVHYIGGLDKGQNLYQIFKWMGLMDHLRLKKMDENAFDKILIGGKDDQEYPMAQGYDNFIKHLLEKFPNEEKAINAYCDKIKWICNRFPMYNLRENGSADEKKDALDLDTQAFIESLTSNKTLQAVLAGNNILYAGVGNKTPLYVHALILNSYIESSWKCVDGGSQIARIMARNILHRGSSILRNSSVNKIVIDKELVTHIEFNDGSIVNGKHFISAIHPSKTLEMTDTELIRSAYRKRLKNLENTISSFSIHFVLKKNCFPYINSNYYYHKEGHIWNMANYTEDNWPLGYALFVPANSQNPEFAESVTVFTYMRFEEMEPWTDTFNTVSRESERSESYQAFKKRKVEKLIDLVGEKFPGLRNSIQTYYTSSPLSFRDYIGNDDGSLYGIAKDYKDALKTQVFLKTKIRNLYFTGQNLNLHGILGSAISGLITCLSFPGTENLVEEIKNA